MRFPTSLLAAFSLLCLAQAAEAAVVPIDPHALYPEGPLWDQGRLLFVEYAGPGIKSWDGKAVKVWWRRDHCGSNALIHFRGDHILVACYDGNYLVELDAAGKELRTFGKDSAGKPFVGPNDFSSDGRGGVYFRPPAYSTSRRRSPARFCTCRPMGRTSGRWLTPSTTRMA